MWGWGFKSLISPEMEFRVSFNLRAALYPLSALGTGHICTILSVAVQTLLMNKGMKKLSEFNF